MRAVYEMLAGRAAFAGRHGQRRRSRTVLEGRARASASSRQRRLKAFVGVLHRSLQKDPKRRLQRYSGRAARDSTTPRRGMAWRGRAGQAPGDRSRTTRLGRGACAWPSSSPVVLQVWTLRPAEAPPRKFDSRFRRRRGLDASLAISPDGLKDRVHRPSRRRVEVVASPAGVIYGDAACRCTEGGFSPFWSPDSRCDRVLRTAGLKAGRHRRRISAHHHGTGAESAGGAWSADGTILFGANPNGPLFRVAVRRWRSRTRDVARAG